MSFFCLIDRSAHGTNLVIWSFCSFNSSISNLFLRSYCLFIIYIASAIMFEWVFAAKSVQWRSVISNQLLLLTRNHSFAPFIRNFRFLFDFSFNYSSFFALLYFVILILIQFWFIYGFVLCLFRLLRQIAIFALLWLDFCWNRWQFAATAAILFENPSESDSNLRHFLKIIFNESK